MSVATHLALGLAPALGLLPQDPPDVLARAPSELARAELGRWSGLDPDDLDGRYRAAVADYRSGDLRRALERLYALLEEQTPKPDLVIFLQAETRTLVERIRGRHRDYENEISETYVNEVNKAYNYFFFHYTQTPLLVIDTTAIDFVHHEKHLDELVEQIRKMEHGVQYYRPLGD